MGVTRDLSPNMLVTSTARIRGWSQTASRDRDDSGRVNSDAAQTW